MFLRSVSCCFLTRAAAGGPGPVLPVPFGPHGLDIVHGRRAAHAVEALARAAVGQAAVGHGGVGVEPLRSGRGLAQGQRGGVRRRRRRRRRVAAQQVALVLGQQRGRGRHQGGGDAGGRAGPLVLGQGQELAQRQRFVALPAGAAGETRSSARLGILPQRRFAVIPGVQEGEA